MEYGGGEIYLRDLALLAQSMGFDVTIFQPAQVQKITQLDNGIYIQSMPMKWLGLELVDLFTKLKLNDFDHLHFLNFKWVYPWRFKKATGTAHGIWWDIPSSGGTIKNIARMHVFKNSIKRLIAVATDSTSIVNLVRSNWPRLASKLHYIPNYVDLQLFNSTLYDKNDAKFKYFAAKIPDRLVVLIPRRLETYRGIWLMFEAAVRAIKTNDNVFFWFVGDGSEKDLLITKVKELELEERIHVSGSIQHGLMPEVYAASDIVVIPSLGSEGQPLACLEAFALKKPVIATLVGDLSDLIIQRFNGILVKPSLEELEKAILDLASNDQLRDYLGENALRVAKVHDKKLWEERYTTFFESFVQSN